MDFECHLAAETVNTSTQIIYSTYSAFIDDTQSGRPRQRGSRPIWANRSKPGAGRADRATARRCAVETGDRDCVFAKATIR
jgi:hypothetical protein